MTTSEPTTGELIEQLHTFDNVDAVTITIAKAALLFIADRLESQEATIDALTARAERAEKERDAAIKDIEMVMIDNICYGCISYKNGECSRCDNRCVPKWRGLPQEGEGKK